MSPNFVASTLNDKISFQQEDKNKRARLQKARIETKQFHFNKEAAVIQAQTQRDDTKAQSKIL